VAEVVAGARGFRFIFENTFDATKLLRTGPIMEGPCRDVFVRWLKETGRDYTLDPWVPEA
jgi:hypothetical protein